jgi:hypothetical protein
MATKPRKLSEAQRRALRKARDYGDPTRGFRSQSEWGGWCSTHQSLIDRGLMTLEMDLTDAGREAAASL